MALSWESLQLAARAWVVAALPGVTVIWARQDGKKPARPFVTLRFGDLVAVGSTDERRTAYVPDSSPGADDRHLLTTVVGLRSVSLTLQASTAGTLGTSTAKGLLSQAQTALALPSLRTALRTAGLSPYDRGTVREISTVLDADFEGRAQLVVSFYVNETASEQTGIIETVETTNDIDI
jgi:hypothetical protein